MFRCRLRSLAAVASPVAAAAAAAAYSSFTTTSHCEPPPPSLTEQRAAAWMEFYEAQQKAPSLVPLAEQRAKAWMDFYESQKKAPPEAPSEAPSVAPESRRPRVLITGFHDWRELENNIWRCRDNPSCRLLFGPPSASPPVVREGPLVRALQSVDADFSFQSLPVVWGTAGACDPLSFDLVVHMGLGVYDNHDTILLECGAYNARFGNDALGQPAGQTMDAGAPQVLMDETMRANVTALEGSRLPGGHTVETAMARPANSYICNETNWRALKAVAHAATHPECRLKHAYFVHLPFATSNDETHEQLAASVASLVKSMVQRL